MHEGGRSVKRSIGLIVLGVGREAEDISKKLTKRLKKHPGVGTEQCHAHRILCGVPADFIGNEKDIVLAILPSRVLTNDSSLLRWEQMVNIGMSRAKERFHLFHQLRKSDILCSEEDPRRKLVEYCERMARDHSALRSGPGIEGLDGFAGNVRKALEAEGMEVRSGGEILPPDWQDKMLVVEGSRRMVALVLHGDLQTTDRWRTERQKWAMLNRVGWRVVEFWHFQFKLDPVGFMHRLRCVLSDEEDVRRHDALALPDIQKAPSLLQARVMPSLYFDDADGKEPEEIQPALQVSLQSGMLPRSRLSEPGRVAFDSAVRLRWRRTGVPITEPWEVVLSAGAEVLIGRSLAAGLRAHQSLTFISRKHCVVRRDGDGDVVSLHNCSKGVIVLVSTDGEVQGVSPEQCAALRNGDSIFLVRREPVDQGCYVDVILDLLVS